MQASWPSLNRSRAAKNKEPMQQTYFFSDLPLWFSIPIGLGYLVVFIIMAILLVRLFRK